VAIRTLLHFRNADLTADINDRYVGLFIPGVFAGGTLLPVVGQLKVDVTPWKLVSSDGMVVEETSVTTRLSTPDGQTTVIAVKAVYVQNNEAIVEVVAVEQSAFYALIDLASYVILGQLTVPLGAIQTLSTYINLTTRMVIDPLTRSNYRGLVTSQSLLPAVNNRVGDHFMVATVAGLPGIWAWNGLIWIDVTNAAQVTVDLAAHRQNLFADEKHLTDDEKLAVVGTSGTPVNGANKLIDNADTRIPTQTENDALVGSDGTPGSGNLYVTQAYHFAVPDETSFVTPIVAYAQLLSANGPYYIGKQIAPSANQYFSFYDSTLAREYTTAAANIPVKVLGVYLDAALTMQVDPATNVNTDIDGFISGVDLYVAFTTPFPDTGYKVLFGKRQTLLTLPKNALMRRAVNDSQTSAETIQTIEAIKGRTFDTTPPTNEQNINLRRALVDVKEYLASVFKSDYVVYNFDGAKSVPEFGIDFVPNIGIPPNYSFQNTGLVSFTYAPATGVVTYASAVVLGSVVAGHVFIDGSNVEFKVTAIGVNQVTIVGRDLSIPLTIDVTQPSNISGSIKPDNNPRKLNLANLDCIVGRERIMSRVLEVAPNDFLPETGSIGYAIQSPLHDLNFREPRVRFYGSWQNRLSGTQSRVVATNIARMLITGFFTDLKLLMDIGNTSPSVTIKVDGVQVGGPLDLSRGGFVSNAFISVNDVQMQQVTVASGLLDQVPHTVELIITNAVGDFIVYGVDMIRASASNTLILPGRCFVQSDLYKLDTIQAPSTPATGVQRRGTVVKRLIDRALTLVTSSYAMSDLDGSSNIPAGVATSGFPNFSVLTGLTKFAYYKAGDVVKLITASSEEVLQISSIPTPGNIIFTSNIAGSGSAVLFHIASTVGPPLDPTREYVRFAPMDLGIGQTTDFSLDFTVPGNRTFTLDDGTTSVAGQNVKYVSAGIEGVDNALQLVSAGSVLRIRAVCSQMDILVANNAALNASITIDGCPAFIRLVGGVGLQRVTILTNARYQSHEITITNAAGVDFAGLILHEPTTSTIPQGTVLSTQNELARYLVSQSTNGNVLPTGTVAIDPMTNGGVFVDSSGTGSVNWTASLDFTKNTAFGKYITTDRANAYFEYTFIGDGFEIEYFSGPDQGKARLLLDTTVLNNVNFPTAFLKNVDVSTGEVDMYSATVTRNKLVVANLPANKHTIQMQVQNPRVKNGASTGFLINVGTFYEVNSSGSLSVTPSESFRKDFFYGLDTLRDERNFDSGAVAPDTTAAATAVTPTTSAGGAGSLNWWQPDDGSGTPAASITENGQQAYLFSDSLSQEVRAWLKVPTGYIAGNQVTLKAAHYSPGISSGTMLISTKATLVRRSVDAVSSTTNQRVSTNTAITISATANRYEEASCDLTSSSGQINGVSVSPGDLILIELTRNTAVDTDTNDVRFLPSATEVAFQ
jgi:hypothetical protein